MFGGYGRFARWRITCHGNNIYKLQSKHTNKFIRISPKDNGGEVDVRGTGGKFTQFRVHLVRDINVVMFESVVYPNKYLACDNNGNVSVYDGVPNQNKECMFEVFMRGNDHNVQLSMQPLNDQSALIKSQQELIESQKQFIDQLQRTVALQQATINHLQQNSQPGSTGNGARGNNVYPVLSRNNNNGNTDDNGETDDGFEHVPGFGK